MTTIKNLIRKLLFILPRLILVGIFLFTLFITVLSNFDYLEPYLPPVYLARASVRRYNDRILIGPYSHLDEMKVLKRRGVQTIISLLDTALPQEKALAEREADNARRLGLEYRLFPLGYIPLDSAHNRATREQIAKSVASDRKITYIHCYLGRHRVVYVTKGFATNNAPTVQKP